MLGSLPMIIIRIHTILFDSSCLLCVCPSIYRTFKKGYHDMIHGRVRPKRTVHNRFPSLLCIPWQKETLQVKEDQEALCCSTSVHNVSFKNC